MKKIVLLCMVLFSAVMLYARPLDYIESGSYAYYIDKRYDKPYARGYLVFESDDDSTLLCTNTIDLSTGKSYPCVTSLITNEEGFIVFTEVSMQNLSGEIKNQVEQGLIDLLNFDTMYKNSQKKIDFASVLEDPWEGYSLYYHFSKLLPMFKFSMISYDSPDDEKAVYYARLFGIFPAKTESVSAFCEIPVSEFVPSDKDTSIELPKAAKKKVKMNGYSFNLDENWKLNKLEGNDSWWLTVGSIRDAQITVEPMPDTIKLNTLEAKLDLAEKWVFYIDSILPSTLKFWKKGQDIYIMYDVYDEDNVITTSIVGITSKAFINFSAYKDVYTQNESYFKKILGIK